MLHKYSNYDYKLSILVNVYEDLFALPSIVVLCNSDGYAMINKI